MRGGEVGLGCLELDVRGCLQLLGRSGLELLLCRLQLLLRALEWLLWSLKPLLWGLCVQLVGHLWASESALVGLIELLKLLAVVGRSLLALLLLCCVLLRLRVRQLRAM